MQKTLTIILLLLTYNYLFSQSDSQKAYNFYKARDFHRADSIYTLIIDQNPNGKNYYNRALTRLNLNDFKGFCKDVKNSSTLYKDSTSTNVRLKYCVDIDTSEFINNEGRKYSKVSIKEKYYDESEVFFYDSLGIVVARYKTFADYKVFYKCPEVAKFPKGDDRIAQFIVDNIDTKSNAFDFVSGNTLKMYIQYDVLTDGKACRAKTPDEIPFRYTDDNLKKVENIVFESINQLPKFEPGRFNGELVNCRFIITIKFDFRK
jgi:hypothetical protein